MILKNLNAQDSAAILGWNGSGLVGYAVRGRDAWACYARDDMGEARRTYKRAGAAMRWMRHTTKAKRFESLAVSDELDEILQEIVTHTPDVNDPTDCLSDPTPRTLAYAQFRLQSTVE